MGFFKRIAVLIALAAAGANSLGAQSLVIQAPPVERASGCHEHGSSAPAQHPTSYQCCLVGHDTAVPQTSQPQPVLAEVHAEFVALYPPHAASDVASHDGPIDSGSPPQASPLRI